MEVQQQVRLAQGDSMTQLALSLDDLDVVETVTAPVAPVERKQEVRPPTPAEWRKWQESASQAQAINRYFVRVHQRQTLRHMTWCEVVEVWKEAHA